MSLFAQNLPMDQRRDAAEIFRLLEFFDDIEGLLKFAGVDGATSVTHQREDAPPAIRSVFQSLANGIRHLVEFLGLGPERQDLEESQGALVVRGAEVFVALLNEPEVGFGVAARGCGQ